MCKKQTEGEIFWEGYEKGIKKATSIFRKHFRGGKNSKENLQETIKRLRKNVFEELEALSLPALNIIIKENK